jgi:hypothetical protein
MKSGRRSSSPPPSESGIVPALPVWKAFVVQFSRDTRAQRGPFAGRVEHMSSGRRARFTSAQQLVAALRKLIGQLGDDEV